MYYNSNRVGLLRLAAASAAVIICQTSPAFAQKPATLATLLLDKGCSIVLEAERDQWRDANISDYQTSGWKAWMTQTKATTPWRTVGDFDGDGLQDVAKIVIRKVDKVWMLGVEFGYKNKAECRRQQIAWNTDKPDARLLGLLAIPKKSGSAAFVCHHVSESMAATCTIASDSKLGTQKADTFLSTDDIPTRTDGYFWAQFRDMVKSDGTALMAFESEKINVGMDMTAMIAAATKDQANPQPNDKVSPGERKALLAQFDAAFNNADKTAHRITADSVSRHAGQTFKSQTITDFAPPNKLLMTVAGENEKPIITLLVGKNAWNRTSVPPSEDTWQFVGDDAVVSVGTGSGIGNMGIVAVRAETINGRKVKTIEVKDITTEAAMVVILSIDEATKLPVRRVDRIDSVNSVTTATYDFSTKFVFPTTPIIK